MNSFSLTYVFSPWKLDFISISIDLWWCNDWIPYCIYCVIAKMMKCFSHLSFLDFQLVLISDRKPLCSTIELMSFLERNFKRRFLYDLKFLSFIVRLSFFENSDIHNALWYTPTSNNNLPSIRRDSESFSSEYKFIDCDIFKYLVFWHKNLQVTMSRIV